MSQNFQTDSERYSIKKTRVHLAYIMVFNLVTHLLVSCKLPRGSGRSLISVTSLRASVAFFCLKNYSFVLRRNCVIFT